MDSFQGSEVKPVIFSLFLLILSKVALELSKGCIMPGTVTG